MKVTLPGLPQPVLDPIREWIPFLSGWRKDEQNLAITFDILEGDYAMTGDKMEQLLSVFDNVEMNMVYEAPILGKCGIVMQKQRVVGRVFVLTIALGKLAGVPR